jgi:hypothetical protein
MPCGSRPSMAAWTRSGARNASEIVMLTLRVLQPSRLAMLSALDVASLVSSLSRRRPRAIDATNVARFSDRIGRAFSRWVPPGNNRRYHESLSNLTPADVYFGRGQTIPLERERIKRKTIQKRRLQHQKKAA